MEDQGEHQQAGGQRSGRRGSGSTSEAGAEEGEDKASVRRVGIVGWRHKTKPGEEDAEEEEALPDEQEAEAGVTPGIIERHRVIALSER